LNKNNKKNAKSKKEKNKMPVWIKNPIYLEIENNI
jgi:hypothetical protein